MRKITKNLGQRLTTLGVGTEGGLEDGRSYDFVLIEEDTLPEDLVAQGERLFGRAPPYVGYS